MCKLWTKNTLFGHFWAKNLKKYCYIWNQHAEIFAIAKFWGEIKMPNFGTKNGWLGIFDKKCLICLF